MKSIREILHLIGHGEWTPAAQVRIPGGQVTDSVATAATDPLAAAAPGGGYFQVTVNGIALDHERVGGRTFDPMLLAVTDYLYDGEVISRPFVVSSKMIAAATDGLPRGMTFANTCVAGPHPYYGRLAVTIILYRVERDDYVRRLLEAAHQTCAAFDVTGSL